MLKNFWYALEFSAAVTRAPRRVRVLGQDLSLHRTEAGAVVALSDLCAHRGGSLSRGKLVGDCLRCPYHGWEYAASGACTRVPANEPGAPIPRRARVDRYPAQERYGLVWVFLGDLPQAERPPLPPFAEFGQPGWRAIQGEFSWRAHYARVVENGLDFAHGPFVHAQSFGNINRPEVPPFKVEQDDSSAHASLSLPAQEPRGLWRLLRPKGRPPVPVTLSMHMPNVVRIHLRLGPRWQIIIFDSNVPVDGGSTRTLWVSLRNFFTGGWADGDARKRTLAIFREDQPVVEAIQPARPPVETGTELFLRSDALTVAYRRLRKRYHDLGWGVDAERAAASLAAGRPLVLPSPERLEVPAEGWMYLPVPAPAR